MNNIVDQFIKLVKIASPSGNEAAIRLYLQKWLKNLDFKFKIDSVGNIYAKNNKMGEPILLCAHMDTVQPGENIKPHITNGVIKSDGTTILGADNKASIAAIMTAIEENNNRHLELLFTVKEETGGGVEFFPFNWIKSKQALIFDSSNPLGGVVLSSPNIYNFHCVLTGKAAHSSKPKKGLNAFVPAFNALSHIQVGELDSGETTINVGLIKGGVGINTIPDIIHISGEVRSYNKKLFFAHLKKIKNIFETEAKKYQVKCLFSKDGFCAGYSFTKSDTYVKQIVLMYEKMGLNTQYIEHSGISDANVLNEHGVKTINLSDGTQFPHSKEEQIEIKNLNKLCEIIKKCIIEL